MKLLSYLPLLMINMISPTFSYASPQKSKESSHKKMKEAVISFFNNEYVQETNNLTLDEKSVIQKADGTTEEIIALRSKLGLTRERANQQFDHLYHKLEEPENELMELGLSRLDSYWTAVGVMHNIFRQYTALTSKENSNEEQKVIERPNLDGRQVAYLMTLLNKLDKKEYKTEGERFLINVEAHKHVQAIYTHVVHIQHHS